MPHMSSPPTAARPLTRGQLGVGYSGRTYTERWVVIDTEVLTQWDCTRPSFASIAIPIRPYRRLPNPAGPPPLGVSRPHWMRTSRRCCGREQSGRFSATRASPTEHVKILRAVIYSHHVRSQTVGGWAGSSWPEMPPMRCHHGSVRGCRQACATWPTCAGNSPPCCGAGARLRYSTPIRRNANPTSSRSRGVHVLIGRIITERNRVHRRGPQSRVPSRS